MVMKEGYRPGDAGELMSLALEHFGIADERHDIDEFRRASELGEEAYNLYPCSDQKSFDGKLFAALVVVRSSFFGGDLTRARDFGEQVFREHGDRIKGPLRYEIAEIIEYAELGLSRKPQ